MEYNCLENRCVNEVTQKVLHAAKDILGERLEKVILHGSYARGDFNEASDVDIFILADIPQDEANRCRSSIRRLLPGIDLEYDLIISLHVTGTDVFNRFKHVTPFYKSIIREGVEIND